MKYPAEQKAQTRERIVEAASRSFRERGADGLGLAPLMTQLGITVGGFYRHFESKDDLYAEAVVRGLKQTANWLVEEAKRAPRGQALRAMIELYLSSEHMETVGGGCVIAALAPEIGRQQAAIRARINIAMKSFMSQLMPFFPGPTETEQRRQFLLLIPGMAGTLMVARAVSDRSSQEEILRSARAFYIESFAKKKSN